MKKAVSLLLMIVLCFSLSACGKSADYHAAMALMDEGKYEDAIIAFGEIAEYKDSVAKIQECKYNWAIALMDEGTYSEAVAILAELEDYSDSVTKLQECKYLWGIALMKEGAYPEAVAILTEVKDYDDSEASIKECIEEALGSEVCTAIQKASVGDVLVFGHYEQDNNLSNGKEPIEWIVVDAKAGALFLVSKYSLDCKHLHYPSSFIPWEHCSCRTWLNETFMNSAFSSNEQLAIRMTSIDNYSKLTSPLHGTSNDTEDKIFLLSHSELEKYSLYACKPTAYAIAQGADNEWWLRSTGKSDKYPATVATGEQPKKGNISYYHTQQDFDKAIRPAMWISVG